MKSDVKHFFISLQRGNFWVQGLIFIESYLEISALALTLQTAQFAYQLCVAVPGSFKVMSRGANTAFSRLGSVLLVHWICYHFVAIRSCEFKFSGVTGLVLKRTNPGRMLSGQTPWGYPHSQAEERRLVGYSTHFMFWSSQHFSPRTGGGGTPMGSHPRCILHGFVCFRTRPFAFENMNPQLQRSLQIRLSSGPTGLDGIWTPLWSLYYHYNMVCYKLKVPLWDSKNYFLSNF